MVDIEEVQRQRVRELMKPWITMDDCSDSDEEMSSIRQICENLCEAVAAIEEKVDRLMRLSGLA